MKYEYEGQQKSKNAPAEKNYIPQLNATQYSIKIKRDNLNKRIKISL
jgi:hypothetical protein